MELAFCGYFTKTHGVKGRLVLREEAALSLPGLDTLFVEIGGARAPHFISDLADSGKGLIVALEEIDSLEKAQPLLGRKVYVDARFIEEDDEAVEKDWSGYELIDREYGSLGRVLSTSHNGAQLLCRLEHGGREVLLPLVDEFVKHVDEKLRQIHYEAPEGLIGVYLDE